LTALDGTGTFRELVPRHTIENEFMVREEVVFDPPARGTRFELAIWRFGDDNLIHLNEWFLEGLNPACGQAARQTKDPGHPFASDVDSLHRPLHWDIGADQFSEVQVGIRYGFIDWWEAEGQAEVQVVLSEAAVVPISVRYETQEVTAIPWVDYLPIEGELIFEPEQLSKTIVVPLIDDGENDDGEFFGVRLFEAEGARIWRDWIWIAPKEGEPPVRVRLSHTLIEVSEGVGVVTGTVELEHIHTEDVSGSIDAIENSAHIGPDFLGMPSEGGAPWSSFFIPQGATTAEFQFEIVDDSVAEDTESFWIRIGSADQAFPGVPSLARVRIIDDDGGGGGK
jgi:hypothetical protein